jgi:hypothetical protein
LTALTSRKLLQRFKRNTIKSMKILFFSLATIALVSLSSFTTVPQTDESGTVPCKWRTVVTVQGVEHYSEWTHGNCNVTDSGKLQPIK